MKTKVPQSRPTDQAFRHDLNGLRALAVILVVAFHFRIGGFSGGFAGVDVFFVISGYLMTRIITEAMDANRFSLGSFYMARVRRIVPALVVMCAILMGFGMVALDPYALMLLGQESFATVGFWSNFLFAAQQGYFNASADNHWLLHTWSLSVEWQFYLLYPLLLAILYAWRLSRGWIFFILLALTALNLVLAESLFHLTAVTSRAYYFMLPNRAWEMLIGGLVVYISRVWRPPAFLGLLMHYGGLAAIIADCLWWIRPETPWPSFSTLLPVAATALVLVSNRANEAWSRLAPVSLIGKWSYSIYLWHWPLWVAANYYDLSGPWLPPVLIAASLFMGAISHELIEKRLTPLIFEPRAGAVLAMGTAASIAALGATLWLTTGFETERVTDQARLRAMREIRAAMTDWSYNQSCNGGPKRQNHMSLCHVGDPSMAQTLIIGDSHAQQIAPRYARLFAGKHGQGALFITNGGCMPVRGVSKPGSHAACREVIDEAYDYAMKSPIKDVIFIAMWSGHIRPSAATPIVSEVCFPEGDQCHQGLDPRTYRQKLDKVLRGFSADIAALEAAGHRVTVVDVMPISETLDLNKYYRQTFFEGPRDLANINRSDFERETAFARDQILSSARRGGADIVNPRDTICDQDTCPTHLGGKLLYMDGGHYRSSVMGDPRFEFLDSIVASTLSVSK